MKLLREPLLHFLLLGGALFCVSAWRGADTRGDNPSRQLRIGEQDVTWLKDTWAAQWQREPSPDELRGLVTAYVKEELLAREAREMGLDRDDTIVRRRLAQKVEFIVQDASDSAEPSEDELQRLYDAQKDRFSDAAHVSFMHVYFTPEHRPAVVAALVSLRAGANPVTMGDPSLIGSVFAGASEKTVAAQFGDDFARALFSIAPGAWQGPIESTFGPHVVRVTATTPMRQLSFAEARPRVLERWHDERRSADEAKYFAGLLKKYDIVVDESVRPVVGTLVLAEPAR